MKYPVYSARINDANYDSIISWYNTITYERPQPGAGGLEGHEAPAYEASLQMFALMQPFTNPYSAGYPNNGDWGSSQHLATTIHGNLTDFGMTGLWNLSKLIQVQMVQWNAHLQKLEIFHEEMQDKVIDDAWITERAIIKPSIYAEEIGMPSWSDTEEKGGALVVMASMNKTALGFPDFTIRANPCEMSLRWEGYSGTYQPIQQIDNVLSFYSPDAPELLPVAHEAIPGNGMRLIFGYYNTAFPRMDTSGFIPLNGQIYWEIQPGIHTVGGVPYLYQLQSSPIINYEGHVTMSRSQIQEFMLELFDVQNGGVEPDGSVFTATNGGASLNNTIPYYAATAEYGVVGNAAGAVIDGNSIFVGGDSLNELTEQFQVYKGEPTVTNLSFWDPLTPFRPKAWDHTDAEFSGYVPYHPELWNDSMDFILEYAKEPDGRFDGFHFAYKVKIAYVTRAWTAEIRNVLFTAPDPQLFKAAYLDHTNWFDSDTGEITYDGRNFCTSIAAVEIGSLSPDIVGNVEYPGFDWSEYDWPVATITLPPGSFLLESGSPAPIYPDFQAAFIYDTHLKKWGRMDLEHKAVFDYMAINTYKPGDPSFTRFGIFGGVLKEDGKIYIFDDEPADSFITYGKVGYYRQGMTSPEEVRVHMRKHSDFAVKVTSSIEGKLIEPSFTRSTDFVQAAMGIHYGGYAAKWHNITISGKYDISYLEFRGITTGRR